MFKKKEKISKRRNAYTGLINFENFSNEFKSLTWTIECVDKRDRVLYSLRANEQRNFEMGFSVVWYSFSDLNCVDLTDMTTLKVYAQIPLCLDIKTGSIVFKEKSDLSNGLSFEWRRALITQIDNFNLKELKNMLARNQKQAVKIDEIVEDKLIKIFQVNRTFLFGCWNPNSKSALSNVIAF